MLGGVRRVGGFGRGIEDGSTSGGNIKTRN